jgi:hypothetical protein
MSAQQQQAKVAQMQARRKEMGEKLDWGDQSAVKAFNAFQESLKQEESKLATLQKEAKEGSWDFDGGWE